MSLAHSGCSLVLASLGLCYPLLSLSYFHFYWLDDHGEVIKISTESWTLCDTHLVVSQHLLPNVVGKRALSFPWLQLFSRARPLLGLSGNTLLVLTFCRLTSKHHSAHSRCSQAVFTLVSLVLCCHFQYYYNRVFIKIAIK